LNTNLNTNQSNPNTKPDYKPKPNPTHPLALLTNKFWGPRCSIPLEKNNEIDFLLWKLAAWNS